MNRNLSLAQRILRSADCSSLEKMLATHNYLHAASRSYEEWSALWTRRDDTSWAHSFGRMRGFRSIWMGSVVDYDERCIENYRQVAARYPEVIGLDYRPLFNNAMHTLTNGIIEMSDDGQTARASYLTPGMMYGLLSDNGKPWGSMLWERYGMDFVKEDGEWKFLHYQVCPEFNAPFDIENPAVDAYERFRNDAEDSPGMAPNFLDDPGPLHLECSPLQPVQDTCPPPLPYQTLNNQNTYTQFACYDD